MAERKGVHVLDVSLADGEQAALDHTPTVPDDPGHRAHVETPAQPVAHRSSPTKQLKARIEAGEADDGIAASNIIWIFGSPGSGTTSLASMMEDLPGHDVWDEPHVGALFGDFYYSREGDRRGGNFILGPKYREVWIRSIRSMVLIVGTARSPGLSDDGYLVIKEPHGCLGAQLLSEALPESRFVFVLRDPRDVIASQLDAQRKGSRIEHAGQWLGRQKRTVKNPDAFVRNAAHTYVRNTQATRKAYEKHNGPKAFLKYEDLKEDAASVLSRLYVDLGIPMLKQQLLRVVEQHAWETIPAETKGPGHSYRKATPGGWKDDLTPKQAGIVKRTTGSILNEYYA
jgi:hypothetical protein